MVLGVPKARCPCDAHVQARFFFFGITLSAVEEKEKNNIKTWYDFEIDFKFCYHFSLFLQLYDLETGKFLFNNFYLMFRY